VSTACAFIGSTQDRSLSLASNVNEMNVSPWPHVTVEREVGCKTIDTIIDTSLDTIPPCLYRLILFTTAPAYMCLDFVLC